MINSNRKGKRAELELAKVLQATIPGVSARRGNQFCGGESSPDIKHNIPGLHIECKYVQALNLHGALQQAIRDCGSNVPVVMHRKNKVKPTDLDWLVTYRLSDILRVFESLHELLEKKG